MGREIDLAWAAGIIDGEGCISLNAERSKHCHTGRLVYSLRLSVNNTDLRMLHHLRAIVLDLQA